MAVEVTVSVWVVSKVLVTVVVTVDVGGKVVDDDVVVEPEDHSVVP